MTTVHWEEVLFVLSFFEKVEILTMVDGIPSGHVVRMGWGDVEGRILDVWEGLRECDRILQLYGIGLLRYGGHGRDGIVLLGGSSGILFPFGKRCEGD